MPLRADDGDFEVKYLHKIRSDFERAQNNRRARQAQARRHRLVRISAAVPDSNERGLNDESGSETSSLG